MKRVRLLILTGLLIAALTLAVAPALAGLPHVIWNWSFEGDKNGDNLPDKWNVKGDVLRVCDHQYASFDNCMMVFKPSNKAAAVWQILDYETGDWTVVTEEASCGFGGGQIGALNLDTERAYYGRIYDMKNGTRYTLYGTIDGGTYPIGVQVVHVTVPNCIPNVVSEDNIATMRWGVLTYPGEGYLGVDSLYIE